ncbi:nuclear transcription factor Y subunit B-3-like [Olea europaea var. sylvestris]|uniref:nuclear transcription factor Y subunit B-3-like n=1 Tax=Olea europaea var. sylvestris TaxID=158386 RepID=UPI000C1D1413|nr:nuclear transcription factor Y subunit B-3-like [Olea europaea var. sylvestris]
MTGKRIQSSPGGSPLSGNISDSKEQDRLLPIANVSRIMKKSLPTNAKISKEAKETVQECVSEFIRFITGEASDKCQTEKRKTINGDDLLWAMTTLGFENYVVPLKVYLNKYRENEGDKNTVMRQEPSPTSDAGIGKITDNLYSFNSDFHAQVTAKGQGGSHKVNIGYGANLVSASYEFDGNVKSVMATNLHHGIEW